MWVPPYRCSAAGPWDSARLALVALARKEPPNTWKRLRWWGEKPALLDRSFSAAGVDFVRTCGVSGAAADSKRRPVARPPQLLAE